MRRAIEALEARAPQTVLPLWLTIILQNRVNSITLCITLNAKTGKIHTETQYTATQQNDSICKITAVNIHKKILFCPPGFEPQTSGSPG